MNAHASTPDISVGAAPAAAAVPDARAALPPGTDGAAPEALVIPVIEEHLKVSRRSAATGHATRVRKVVRERLRDVDLPTWHDEVEVERVAVGRVVGTPPEVREEGEVLVIPVVEERLVVRTERVLREEIRITRHRRAERERRAVLLRAEVAIVERLDPATGEWTEIDAGAATAAQSAAGPRLEASNEAPADRSTFRQPPSSRTTIMYTVIGAFDDRQAAQRAFDQLIMQGFPRETVDLQSRPATLERAATAGTSANEYSDVRHDDDGFFAGVRHFFASLFGTDDETQAGMYSEAIRRGGSVVVVDASDEQQADRAATVLREQGGMIDLDERSANWRAEGWRDDVPRDDDGGRGVTGGTAGAMAAQQLGEADRVVHTASDDGRVRATPNLATDASRGYDVAGGGETDRTAATEGEVVMPVVQEEMRIGKRAIEQGGVRVVRRVTETPVSELVRLREERARIDRRPADRAATSAELENFREGTVEVRERTEEPVVQKVARVVEEVVVGREVNERTERVEDKVRRTDVEIDRLAREADESLQRATGDDALRDTDDVDGLPGDSLPPRDRTLGEKLMDGAKGERRPRQ